MNRTVSTGLILWLALAASPAMPAGSYSISIGGVSVGEEPVSDTPYPAKVTLRPARPKPGRPYTIEVVCAIPANATQAGDPSPLPGPDGASLRHAGTSSSLSIVNGKSSSKTTLTFSGVAPEKPGEYRIPATTLTLGPAKISVPESLLIVRENAEGAHAYRQAKLIVETPAGPFYVGREIPVRIRAENTDDETITNLSGLSFVNDDHFTSSQKQVASADGKSNEILITLTPLSAGVCETSLNAGLVIRTSEDDGERDPNDGAFGGFFSTGRRLTRRDVSIPLPKLTVLHVPEAGKPASYRGAIGSFALGPVQIAPEKGRAGEAMILNFILRGDSLPERVIPPELAGEGWRVKEEDPAIGHDAEGRPAKQFKYSVTPIFGGNLKTPSGEFSWFDPSDNRYHTASIPGIPVTVEGPSAPDPGSRPQAPQTVGIAPAPSPDGGLVEYPHPAPTPAFIATQAALLGLLASVAGVTARSRFLDTHPEIRRRRLARRALRRHGNIALRALRKGDAATHADEVRLALRDALPAFVDSGEKSFTGAETLAALPLDDATRRDLAAYFESEDAARYGDEPASAPKPHAAGAFGEALQQLERNLR